MTPDIPEGYWQDAEGNLVPEAKVKPEHKLEDQLVRQLASDALKVSRDLEEFREEALKSASAFRAIVAERYGAKKGGKKGNMTLRTYDGTLEMQVAVGRRISFGTELTAAKELVDDCINEWAKGVNDNIRVLVNHAFQVDQQGKISVSRVLALRSFDIKEPKWLKAMEALSDAVRSETSKTYVRLYRIDTETGVRTPISLDVAKV